tara:strand:+ start:4823 stop:6733 length:1911 start_codon:yes stop_codon:yes gene_type:complete
MAKQLKRMDVSELDFDDIKTNLKTFLRGQTEFTDYDFEGSGMNILLDTLAYNTHYLAFNANMLANEMFIDSAALRSSVVSHAKTLGYETGSVKAPIATVSITLNNVSNSTRTLSAGTVFNTTVAGESYQFATIADVTQSKSANDIIFNDIKIYEGTFVTQRYTVNSSDADQRFVINDNRCDTSTLSVSVQNSSSDTTTTTYTKATDITQLTDESKVFFLQEVEAGRFEVYFGDGVVSSALSDGNIVLLKYIATNVDQANGADTFTSSGAIDGETSVTVTTVDSASGGSQRETIESIKLNAPLDYAAQGRCVTANDYVVFARKLFPQTKSVNVFGGEDGSFDSSLGVVDSQEFGKVFISIRSTTGNNLTVTQKDNLVKDLQKFNVASITPVIIDPEVTNIILETEFQFNSSKTTKDKETLKSEVTTVLTNYNTNTLNDFNKMFRYSELQGQIDDADDAILNSGSKVYLSKTFTPQLLTSQSHDLFFNNPFFHPHSGHSGSLGGVVASTGFKVSGNATDEMFFDDDGKGNIRRFYLVGTTRNYVDLTAGTIDYVKGTVKIKTINITSVSDIDGVSSSDIRIVIVPDSKDIKAVRNQILNIDLTNTTILPKVDTISIGQPGAASSFSTTTTMPSASQSF